MSDLVKFNSVLKNPATDKYLMQVLGQKKESFVVNLTALVNNNASLQSCEPLTLMYAALRATALDLPLDQNLGFAYVIPYKNTKKQVTEAQFQMGVKGFKQLAFRSGDVKIINDGDIREGEIKSFNYLTGNIEIDFIQDFNKRQATPIVGYFSYFETKSGQQSLFYMSKEQVEAHAKKYSKAYNNDMKYNTKSSLWSDSEMFDAMARKTVTKLNLSKNAPLSITKTIQEALVIDQKVIRSDSEAEFVDRPDAITEKAESENPLSITDAEVVTDQPQDEIKPVIEAADTSKSKTEKKPSTDIKMDF